MIFYTGLHQPADAKNFPRACISRNRLVGRRKPVECDDVMIDSGAFTMLERFGGYPEPVETYADELHRLWSDGVVKITIAVAQDYMCEPFMLAKTGLTIAEHQRLTIGRYDALILALRERFSGSVPFQVMPVLQGYSLADYLSHLEQYGARLTPGMWVGVGSVCKRQGNVAAIEDILSAIKGARPDLRLHGFRRETDCPAKSACPSPSLQRRQHGVVLCGAHGRSERKRLARGQVLSGARQHAVNRTGAAAAVRMTRTAASEGSVGTKADRPKSQNPQPNSRRQADE